MSSTWARGVDNSHNNQYSHDNHNGWRRCPHWVPTNSGGCVRPLKRHWGKGRMRAWKDTRERWRADCIEQYPVSLLFSFSPLLLFPSQITTSSDGLYVYYWFVVEHQKDSLALPPYLPISLYNLPHLFSCVEVISLNPTALTQTYKR